MSHVINEKERQDCFRGMEWNEQNKSSEATINMNTSNKMIK